MKNKANITLVIIFFALLLMPPIVQIAGIRVSKITSENRLKAQFPDLNYMNPLILVKDIQEFMIQFDQYYNDNFGFRDLLIKLFRDIKITIFNTNPLPDKVVKGQDGWFFLGNSYSDVIKESKGIDVFSKPQLDSILTVVKAYHQYFNIRGIRFYLAIAPNKHTIYGQYLPIIKSRNKTKLEQVKEELSINGIDIIDLKDDFPKSPHFRFFHKTNTHWNDYGMFFGYQTLIKKLRNDFPKLKPLELNDFRIDSAISNEEDLTNLLSLKAHEVRYLLHPKYISNVKEVKKMFPAPKNYFRDTNDYERHFVCDCNNLKVLIFHDSFFQNMPEFLKENFGETIFIWLNMNPDLIQKFKPDIVIYERVERDIDVLLNSWN